MPPLSPLAYQTLTPQIAKLKAIRLKSLQLYARYTQDGCDIDLLTQEFLLQCEPSVFIIWCIERQDEGQVYVGGLKKEHVASMEEPFASATFERHMNRVEWLLEELRREMDECDVEVGAGGGGMVGETGVVGDGV
ncbi:MAG: hypothetical protein Q9169_008107 [Polycauliona sp. 2 TL-2023]